MLQRVCYDFIQKNPAQTLEIMSIMATLMRIIVWKQQTMLPYCHSARLPAHPDAHMFLLYYGQSNSSAQVQDLCAKAAAPANWAQSRRRPHKIMRIIIVFQIIVYNSLRENNSA